MPIFSFVSIKASYLVHRVLLYSLCDMNARKTKKESRWLCQQGPLPGAVSSPVIFFTAFGCRVPLFLCQTFSQPYDPAFSVIMRRQYIYVSATELLISIRHFRNKGVKILTIYIIPCCTCKCNKRRTIMSTTPT